MHQTVRALMRRSATVAVAVLVALVVAMLLGGCYGPAPEVAAGSVLSTTLAATSAAPIVLKVQSHGGPTNAYRLSLERIIKRLESGSGGKIKVAYYPGDALVNYE